MRFKLWISYKTFEKENFLLSLSSVDWTPVYIAQDVNDAVRIFTELFLAVLNFHAPWIRIQKRKNYAPWISEKTKELIKKREEWKQVALRAAKMDIGGPSQAQVHAWNQYKSLRNRINNQKRNEEHRCKAEKASENLSSAEKLWNTTKKFMGWSQRGPPQQLISGGLHIRKSYDIASQMNQFFLEKFKKLKSVLGILYLICLYAEG